MIISFSLRETSFGNTTYGIMLAEKLIHDFKTRNRKILGQSPRRGFYWAPLQCCSQFFAFITYENINQQKENSERLLKEKRRRPDPFL